MNRYTKYVPKLNVDEELLVRIIKAQRSMLTYRNSDLTHAFRWLYMPEGHAYWKHHAESDELFPKDVLDKLEQLLQAYNDWPDKYSQTDYVELAQ